MILQEMLHIKKTWFGIRVDLEDLFINLMQAEYLTEMWFQYSAGELSLKEFNDCFFYADVLELV